MASLLNIVHPYTFKLVGDTFVIGPVDEFKERDEKVAAFVNAAMGAGVRVLHHRDHPSDSLDGAIRDAAFRTDSLYAFLFDPRIETVVTTPYGMPIADVRSERIPETRWAVYKKYFASESQFAEKIGVPEPDSYFFIGGALEACVTHAANYIHEKHRHKGQPLWCVRELCATFDAVQRTRCEGVLAERKIEIITYDEAMSLLKK